VMTPMRQESDNTRNWVMVFPFKFVQRYQNVIFSHEIHENTNFFYFQAVRWQ